MCLYCALERHPNLERKKYSKNEVKWKRNDRQNPMAKVKICDCHINKADSHNTKGIKWTVSKGEKWITWKVCEVVLVKCVHRMRLLNVFTVPKTGKTLENSPLKWIIRRGKKRNKTKILFKKKKKQEESILKVSLTLWSMRVLCIEFKVQALFAKKHSKVFE